MRAPGFALVADDVHAARVRGGDRSRSTATSLCQGVRVEVTDANASRPYELGIRLLHALRTQKSFRWTREGALDWLVGTRRLRAALERGDTPEAILASGCGRPRALGTRARAVPAVLMA